MRDLKATVPGMTPGPWQASNIGLGPKGKGPYTFPLGTDPDEAAANARAIAALPDCLEALDRIAGQAYDAGIYGETEANGRLAEVLALARAALAKAKGGSDA